MKKLLQSLLFVLGATPLLVVASPVYAVNLNAQVCSEAAAKGQGTPTICGDNESGSNTNPIVGPDGVMTRVLRIFAAVLGIAAVIVIIIAGMRFVLSGGDGNSVAGARRAVMYAIVGIVVAASAQGIVSLVLTRL